MLIYVNIYDIIYMKRIKVRDSNFNKWDGVYDMEDKNFNENNNEYNDDNNESEINVKLLIFIALIIAVIVILFMGIKW